jgi:mono/diheme cytochrome c family protein
VTGRTARRRAAAALAVAVAAALLAAGCGGSDDDDAAAGPAATAAPTAPAATAPATTAPAPVGPGSVSAGKQVFAQTCAGCHAGLGTRAAFGPRLAEKGLSTATIRTTVVDGRNQMPASLVEGQELADVVAYVESLQQ